MGDYTLLHVTYVPGTLEKITPIIPERARSNGKIRGFLNDEDGFNFHPPLTKVEIIDITSKLVDLESVKEFDFIDTASLGRHN
ncbi:hypothetical protein HOD75_03640 [archaeon]|jgi:hypothetical protein|nr:hypothetical protein [archaeon]MBT4241964.1 hypothetical protein [archaeon]MBT4418511.1 hypothetical protein [archaeon]